MPYSVVGESVIRPDLFRKVTGTGRYAVDIQLPHMVYGKLLRSPYAHARIVRIDTSRAEKLPGVVAVLTGSMLPGGLWGSHIKDQPALASDIVRFHGEPLAAVAAIDEEIAEEACQQIEVEYEPLAASVDLEQSLAPQAPLVHPHVAEYERQISMCRPVAGTNILNHTVIRRGNLEAGLHECALVFEQVYRTQAQEHVSLEPSACTADWQRDDHLTLWTSTQCPFIVRDDVARTVGLPASRVRVIVPDVGGGFGGKVHVRLDPICALLSRAAGRPVQMVHTRYEEFVGSTIRHPSVIALKAGVAADGTLLAWQAKIQFDTGAYSDSGEMVSWQAALGGAGPYRIPNVAIDSYSVYTNRVPAGAFRGMGWPQVMWAVESHVDQLASRLGMDPLEFRLKNLLHDGDRTVTGEVLSTVGLEECLSKAAAAIDWGEPLPAGQGRGLSLVMKSSAPNSTASAMVKVNDDGHAQLVMGAAEIGTGSQSVLAQICAEGIGIPFEAVEVPQPDTDYSPFDRGAVSDRTTYHLGDAVYSAASMVRQQLLEIAAVKLEADVQDLDIQNGWIGVRGVPGNRLSVREIARAAQTQRGGPIIGHGRHLEEDIIPLDPLTGQSAKAASHFKFGAQAAQVEVDRESGAVRVIKVVSAHDLGRAVNPQQAEGQIEGAVVQGIGFALLEEMQFEDGQVQNPSLMEYRVPTAPDVPEIVPILVENPYPFSPFGVKGVGEPGIIGVAPAVGNAVHDAVGVFISDLPITWERVLTAIEKKGDS